MKPKASDDLQVNRDKFNQKPGFKSGRQMRHAGVEVVFPEISLVLILRHLWRGVRKLFVVLRYFLFKMTGGIRVRWRMSWVKLVLLALAVFILTKKDIQFSINMKAPLGALFDANEAEGAGVVPAAQRLSLVQPLSLSEQTTVSSSVAAADDLNVQAAKDYIKRFRKVAIVEMRKFGIPGSVKMGQALLESLAGQKPAAVKDHNHFGAPFSKDHFDSAWENWRAHSMFIQRISGALPLDRNSSYKDWARGLKKLGYSEDPDYDDKLIEVIERYQLYLLDEDEI